MRRSLIYIFVFCLLVSCHAQPKTDCAHTGGSADFLPRMDCPSDFNYLQGKPLTEKLGHAQSVKIVYRLSDKKIYFLNSTRFPFHFEFCVNVLSENEDLSLFNKYNYHDNPKRDYVLCNLNYHSSQDVYALEFMAEDDVDGNRVNEIYKKIEALTFFHDKVKVMVTSPQMDARLAKIPGLPLINADVIYNGRKFVALNKGVAYGYLRRVDISKLDSYELGQHDLVVLNGLPNQLAVVAGVISVPFQTPLCHISLLCVNRGTPNATFRDAWTNKQILELENELVRYEVTADTFLIKATTESEANAFWKKTEQRKPISLSVDTTVRDLVVLQNVSFKEVSLIGGKAANFAELLRIRVDKKPLPLPEGSFAIPFYFYYQHLQINKIDAVIDSLLSNEAILKDPKSTNAALAVIRKKIKDATVNREFLALIIKKLNENGDKFVNYRFRSSTNAEDVKGFNGAGLYDSKTGSLTDKEKPVEKAIKAVWASLWDERAFAEREYFRIDQRSVAMGLLVHRAFGTEISNGVAITKHMYRKDYPAYTINTQIGEISVVTPPDSVSCDQLIISLGEVTGSNKIAVEYISRSNLTKEPVMTTSQLEELTKYLTAIKEHFFYKVEKGNRYGFRDYGMDVEFKIDAHTGNLYIKQARSL